MTLIDHLCQYQQIHCLRICIGCRSPRKEAHTRQWPSTLWLADKSRRAFDAMSKFPQVAALADALALWELVYGFF